jgi:hypothetical protein
MVAVVGRCYTTAKPRPHRVRAENRHETIMTPGSDSVLDHSRGTGLTSLRCRLLGRGHVHLDSRRGHADGAVDAGCGCQTAVARRCSR